MKHMVTTMIVQVLWFLLAPAQLFFHLVPLPPLVAAASAVSPPPPMAAPRPGCPSVCGDVRIPYPFGVGVDCAWAKGYDTTCNHSFNPPRPYLGNIEVMDISVETGEMRVFSPLSYACYNSSNTTARRGVLNLQLDFTDTMLYISPMRNQFTAIGCSTLARLKGMKDWSYYTGCISYCESIGGAADDGDNCTGLGCCQTSIPDNLTRARLFWRKKRSKLGSNSAWTFSPCNYAFIGEKGWYKFNRSDLQRDGNNSFRSRVGDRTIPLVLDWAINGSCQRRPEDAEASAKPSAPACVSANSQCVNATQGPSRYLCKCSEGYSGNPYVSGPGNCTNINECELRKSNLTKYGELYPCHTDATCHDTDGGYECPCKFGLRGDGKTKEGCLPIVPAYAMAILATGAAILFLGLLLWFVHKERKKRLRRGFFDKNGGKLLEGVQINVYTEEQLKEITNQYSNSIGKGNFGNVFMGTIEDNQRVAVKRAIRGYGNKPPEGGDFVHEILFQFQMRHKNLVRLVGCCLETKVPMLVFEFISGGSLFDVLHGTSCKQRTLSLLERLVIAIGSAEALVYMHSHGHQKRIHGDIKSANILLDDDLSPKVSDFGSSKVVSSNSRYVQFVASDINYVDPVYMKTYRFTEKSDVYSFGVVLLELITGKAVKYDGNNSSLPIDFAKCCKVEGNGRKMYDQDILADDDAKSQVYECLDRIGALAVHCLKEDVDERPAMVEVLEELKRVKAIASRSDSYSVAG